MNKQELIKRYENTCCTFISINGVLEDLKQLDEPQEVTVPQIVADWYEDNKDDFETNLFGCIYEIFGKHDDNELTEFEGWIIDEKTKPFITLVNMHQFGYTVEKEKRYIVKIK